MLFEFVLGIFSGTDMALVVMIPEIGEEDAAPDDER